MSSINDTVVYPGYGVAVIKRGLEKNIGGSIVKLYELQFMSKDVTILIPIEGFNNAGIRQLSTPKELFSIFEIFCYPLSHSELMEITMSSWNRRSKEYQNRIRKGSLAELATIYRDFKNVEKHKTLSFGEKTIMLQVESLLAEECAIIEGRNINEVVEEIRLCCQACVSGLSHTVLRFLSFKTPFSETYTKNNHVEYTSSSI